MDNKIPNTAFQFLAQAAFSPPAEGPAAPKERTLTGIAYGGGLVTDHGYWSNLLIDLATVTVDTPIPLLNNHERDDPVGIVTSASTANRQLAITARLFADIDEDAAAIAAKADKGFPWQLSAGIWPQSIEDVQPGVEFELNGQSFTGPAVIFRNARVREVSVVAVGADSQTQATVLAADIPRITRSHPHHEQNTMTPEQIKALQDKHAELEAKLAEREAEIVKLSAANPDPAKFVPVDAMQAMQAELAQLKADAQARAVDELVKPALACGKLMAAQEAWARELGAVNLKALQDFLALARPVAALAGPQTGGVPPVGGLPTHEALAIVELAAAYQVKQKAMGIEVDDLAAVEYVKAQGGVK